MADIHDPVSIQCIPRRAVPRFSLVLAACLLATSHARAEGLGGALGFANDNVYRGISLTAGRPAWLADLHYDLGTDWVIGLGGTAERPPRRSASAQVTAYIDRRWQLNEDWASKVGAIHYAGAGQGCPSAVSAGCARTAGSLSYDELNAAIGYRGRWRASIALSANAGASYAARHVRNGFGAWAELTYHQLIADRFSADIGIGYADLTQRDVRNYRYGSAGLSYRVGDAYLYLTRLWTSPFIGVYPDNPYSATSPSRARWVASVIWSFQGS
jgi:uncharacterized protein (TIGR02001 family)